MSYVTKGLLIEFKFQNIVISCANVSNTEAFCFSQNTLSYGDALAPGLIHSLCVTYFDNEVCTSLSS